MLPHSCDSLSASGTLRVNLTNPLSTKWLPFDPKCQPLPEYLPALWHLAHGSTAEPTYPLSGFNEDYLLVNAGPLPSQPVNETLANITRATYDLDPVSFLQKKRKYPPTVLIMGDSVDRNGLVNFCQMMKTNLTISHYADLNNHPPGPVASDLTLTHGPKFDGWDQRGLPHRCEVGFAAESGKAGTALRVINGFHYGMDALDEFNTPGHSDWHAPGRVEVRIDKLFVPMIDQLGGADKVDLIIFHSGMWDLVSPKRAPLSHPRGLTDHLVGFGQALFGMQDDKTSWALTKPLTAEQLAWWQDRMRRTLAHVRHRFPKARLVLRKQHRVDEALKGTPYITNLRVHQLRHLQEEIARSEGLPTFGQ